MLKTKIYVLKRHSLYRKVKHWAQKSASEFLCFYQNFFVSLSSSLLLFWWSKKILHCSLITFEILVEIFPWRLKSFCFPTFVKLATTPNSLYTRNVKTTYWNATWRLYLEHFLGHYFFVYHWLPDKHNM